MRRVPLRGWGGMVAPCNRPKGGLVAPFGLGIVACMLAPAELGVQDLTVLLARPPATAERSSSASTRLGATYLEIFNASRRANAVIPLPVGYMRASIDPGDADITGLMSTHG